MELIHGDQPIIERLHPELVHGEAEGGMGADQHLVVASQERLDRIDLAAALRAGRVAQVPFRLHLPIRPKTEPGQQLVVEARADGFLRHDDDRLSEPLIMELVEGDEHQGTALSRGGRRLDEKVLFAPFLVGPLLHRPHAKRVGPGR